MGVTVLVALRKESVDRNTWHCMSEDVSYRSLSARRAWIEIAVQLGCKSSLNSSLSARRAWIEIFIGPLIFSVQPVALRKESVDRNKYVVQCRKVMGGRSPQGERG